MALFICVMFLVSCTTEQESSKDKMNSIKLHENDVAANGNMQSFFENVKGTNEKIEGIPGNMINEGRVCESGEYIYYGIENCIYKNNMDSDEENKQLLVEENEMCREICVAGDYVYYIAASRIKRIDINGGEAVCLTDIPALYMQVTEKKIYFACNGVYSMNLDGSELMLLTKEGLGDEGTSDLIWLNLYKDYVLYVSTAEHMTLYAVKKDASEVYCLKEHVNFPIVEGDYVYYQDREERIVELSLLTGEQRNITESFQVRPIFMNNKMYFTDYFGVYCFNIDTGETYCVYPDKDVANESEMVDNIDLFWITEKYIFFTGAAGGIDGITYADFESEKKGVLK